jgi:putative restriction endonuclease
MDSARLDARSIQPRGKAEISSSSTDHYVLIWASLVVRSSVRPSAPQRGLRHTPTVRAYVGVTDGAWYRFLAARPDLDEVNFLRPSSDRDFRAIALGEPFYFKTHYADGNRVVGGGFYSGFAAMPVSEAWGLFGEANGAASLADLRIQLSRYRQAPLAASEDPTIGCVFIRDTKFFPLDLVADPPPKFAANVVQGKGYDLGQQPTIDTYFSDLLQRLLGVHIELDLGEPWHRPGPVYGDKRLAPGRLGQQSFQAVVLGAYGQRCAVTGEKIRPVLQAAHIRPTSFGGEHRIDNGLLLRSDVHTLFDCGYLAVDPNHRLLVSRRLRADFDNGEQFYQRAGEAIRVPERRVDRPNRECLEWHLDEVFLAS